MMESSGARSRPDRRAGGGGWRVASVRLPELMDDPGLPEAEHLQALSALRRINALSFTAAGLAGEVAALAGRSPTGDGASAFDPFTVVDVACGGGDVTLDLAARLGRSPALPCRVRVLGIDVSPRAVARARGLAAGRRASSRVTAEFAVHDVVAAGCPACDVAVSSLFLHHLDDDTAAAVLRGMGAAARCGIVISDLVRSGLGLALAVLGTTVLSGSRVARIDGPRSVRAARTPGEYRRLLDAAALTTATIRRTWPERMLLTWARPPAVPTEAR